MKKIQLIDNPHYFIQGIGDLQTIQLSLGAKCKQNFLSEKELLTYLIQQIYDLHAEIKAYDKDRALYKARMADVQSLCYSIRDAIAGGRDDGRFEPEGSDDV